MKSNSQHNQQSILLSSSQNQLTHVNNHFQNNTNNNNNPNGSSSVKSTHHSNSNNDEDIMNFETLINKLAKGSINDKSIAIKKLLFLYQHSRARIYLYQRRIVQSLQLSLLIQQKDVSLSGLTLLQKILTNASSQSQIGSIFKKKLLSKVVLNLGSSDINVRKISHKCVHQFIRKFKDYQAVVMVYLKTALRSQSLQQSQQSTTTKHLKLKSINSLHSLLMAQPKGFRIDQQYSLQLIQQLISSSYQKEFIEIRRAALICLICVLKITGSENTLKLISMKTQNQLYHLRMESEELAALLEMIMKHHLLMGMKGNNSNNNTNNNNNPIPPLINSPQSQSYNQQDDDYPSSQNAPSPKFISIQQSQVLIQKQHKSPIDNLPKSIQQLAKSIGDKLGGNNGNGMYGNSNNGQKIMMGNNNNDHVMILPRSVQQLQQKMYPPFPGMSAQHHHSLSDIQPEPHQLKIFNQVSYAEQFLKKLQKISFTTFSSQSLEEIKSFAPFLQKYLVDESIKLFSISKKIVQVIFDSMQQGNNNGQKMIMNEINNNGDNTNNNNNKLTKRKQVYIIVVPCVVKGIGNKRFIVRKNLDKLVRTYAKNHPEVWLTNFLDRFIKTQNIKIKQILIDLFSYAYKASPQFYYPVDKPFQIFDMEISNKNSTLRWKAIDCVILLIQRQGKQTVIEEMLQRFSTDSYHKILRKLNKNINITTTSNNNNMSYQDRQIIQLNNNMIEIDIPTPVSNYKRKFKRNTNQRILTDQNEKLLSIQKSQNNTDRNMSEQRKINLNKGLFFKDKQNRKSFIDYDLKQRRKTQKRSRQSKQRTSLQRLPELKLKTSINSQSLSKNELPQSTLPQSPVKKSFTEKNIMYTEKSQLQSFQDPKGQLQRALMIIKNISNSWMSHFDSINKIRAVIENHPIVITQQHLQSIVTDLINCLNGNSRSGVMKISLICLDQLLLKLKKRLYPYSEIITQAILKKSISTSEFMADQLKKCIIICTEQLCIAKIIPYINSVLKQSKNTEIKLNILLIIQTMVRQQKLYKKQSQWIWTTLIELHDQPQFQLRQQCKTIVKLIVQLYKSQWKQDVSVMKRTMLQKVDKIIKTFMSQQQRNNSQSPSSLLMQQQGIQFEKILSSSKGINSKYFTTEYTKFQQTDRMLLIRKNWKQRVKNINDFFNIAFQYSNQFQINLNARKYVGILCEHLDEKNPGQLVNAVGLLIKCMQVFVSSQLMQQVIGVILQKYLLLLQSKRGELISTYQRLVNRVYVRFDSYKIIKELVKLVVNSNSSNSNIISSGGLKLKVQALNQLIWIVNNNNNSNNSNGNSNSNEQLLSSLLIKRQQLSSNSNNMYQKQKSKQKLRNKQNTLNKQILPININNPINNNNNIINNNNNIINNNNNNIVIGTHTPTSSSVNIPSCIIISNNNNNNCLTNTTTNSQNKHYQSQQKQTINNSNNSNSSNYKITQNISNNNKLSTPSMNIIMKMVTKLTNDKAYQNSNIINAKLKQLISCCNRKSNNSNSGSNNSNNNMNSNNEGLIKINNQREMSFVQ